jgi:hypothetical protein
VWSEEGHSSVVAVPDSVKSCILPEMNGKPVFLRISVFLGLQTLCLAVEQGKLDLRFSASAPYSSRAAVSRHFGYTSAMPDYNVTNELFQAIVPASQSTNTNTPWGLLVWISPSDEPRIPSDWDAELEKRQLILVGAYRSGNGRQPVDRFRLALDATYNICRRYKVNRDRIYVGGFSGGGRIASMLGFGEQRIQTRWIQERSPFGSSGHEP